jgi:hypothetical protein
MQLSAGKNFHKQFRLRPAKCADKTIRPNRFSLYTLILLTLLCCAPISAQNSSVTLSKRASLIPKSCEAGGSCLD